MRTCDVAIVGGGPGGAAAAATLARAGRDVVVVDKASFPRDKCCGDGLTTGALRLLDELGFDPAAVPSWQPVDDVRVRSPSGRTVRYPLPADAGLYAAVAERYELDAAVLDLARKAGAEVLEGHACTGAVQRADRVVVDVAGVGEVQAHYAIGADGMWSPLRRHLGLAEAGYLGEWHAFRQYFRNVTGPAATELHVLFEVGILPGYFWSFPLPGGRANVGFGIQRSEQHRVRDMKHQWPELLDRPHIRALLGPDAEPEAPHKAWPIPARIDRIGLAAGRALFVGDAAAACDPMTGEGIGQALATGVWAAEALLVAGSDDAPLARRTYEARVRAGLVADHHMSTTLMRALKHRKGARFAVRLSGASDWTRRNFGRWLFEDYPRAILLTPRRWHRGMLTGPGAFRDERNSDRNLPGTRQAG